MTRILLLPLALFLAPLACSPAWALDFDAAIGLSARLPEVDATRQALQLRTTMDAALPRQTGNPEVAVSPGVGFGPGGTGPAAQVNLAQTWNLGDLAGARRQASALEREALGVEVRARHLRAKLGVAHAWLQLAEAQELLLAARAEQELAQQLADLTHNAAGRGALTALDAAEARAFAADAELKAVYYEGEVHDRAAQLAMMTHLPTDPLPEATGPAPAVVLPADTGWKAAIARAQDLPDARQRRLEVQAEKARATEQQASHASVLVLGAQAQRDAIGDMQVLGTIGLRWSAFDRGQRPAAQATERVARAEGEAETARAHGAYELAMAWHEVEHSRERESVLRTKLVPAAVELARLREQAFGRGASTVFDVLRARRDRSEARRRLVEAESERLWSEIKAWLLLAAMSDSDPDAPPVATPKGGTP